MPLETILWPSQYVDNSTDDIFEKKVAEVYEQYKTMHLLDKTFHKNNWIHFN